jgi:hypothetical protein
MVPTVSSSPAEFRAFIKNETERLGRVIRDAEFIWIERPTR